MDEIRRTEDDDLQGRTGYRESKEIIATFYAESWSTRTTLPPRFVIGFLRNSVCSGWKGELMQ